MSAHRRPRLLVLIVASSGEGPIEPTLARVPASLSETFDAEVLVITDRTDRAPGHAAEHGDAIRRGAALPFPLTVLSNPASQGYGGNQKLGFHYAIERGIDFVAVVHGGRPDAAAGLPGLVAPLADGRADAVLGSRIAGHRILTGIQNRLLRSRLRDFHSGYRAYSTAALRRVPFHLNCGGAPFDTEIAIQLMLAGLRIIEVAMPAGHKGGNAEASGVRYSKDVLMACVKARAQELSLFFDRKFDCLPSTVSNVHYKPRLGFESTHTLALDRIRPGSRVLDIGCAGGYFGKLLRERGCHTTGVDRLPLDEGNTLDAFHLHDLNRAPLPVDLSGFDCAVMLDVLEHLQSPETFVDEFKAAAARNPNIQLIISTPNVAFGVIRLMLLAGQFNYGKRGILDLMHTRLFTFGTFRRPFEQSGYEILAMKGVPAPFPLALGNGRLARGLLAMHKLLIRISRSLFAFQIFAIVRPKPGLAYLLDQAVIGPAP